MKTKVVQHVESECESVRKHSWFPAFDIQTILPAIIMRAVHCSGDQKLFNRVHKAHAVKNYTQSCYMTVFSTLHIECDCRTCRPVYLTFNYGKYIFSYVVVKNSKYMMEYLSLGILLT